jgi:FixJ family two-component response regulator
VANGLLQSAKSQVVMAGGGSRLASEKQTVLAGVDVRAVAPQLSTELLYVLVDELVSEKRLEFRSKLGVQIQFDPVGGYGVFAQVVEADLKRILSNLVNNAVEALAESKGDVILRVIAKNSEFCAIEVCDTGVGIDAATLEKLGSVEVSTKSVQGGKSGSGLGVLSSKRLVQSWGGDLNFDSKPGSGTKVTLTLKTSRVPEWFCSALSLSSNKQIAIVDDDQSIHSVWEERLRAHPVKLSHYANPHQLIAAHRQGLRFDRYLIDYEFLGQTQNGLDLIEKEQIAAKSVLVTSRHNETNVRTRARELQVSIVPKALAALVPIEVGRETSGAHPAQERTVVLLDDDELIRMMWESAAKKDGVELKTFSRWGDLEQWLSENPEARDLRFYIDVELGKGELSGVDIAQKIVGLQRGSVFLATGHDPSEFQGHSFLAGVVGKAPPKQSWKS